MDEGLITLFLFVFLMIGLISGLSITFVLGVIGTLFAIFLWGTHSLGVIPSLIFGKAMLSFGLIAIPLFILMGTILQESGMADALFGAIHIWGGRLRGGVGRSRRDCLHPFCRHDGDRRDGHGNHGAYRLTGHGSPPL